MYRIVICDDENKILEDISDKVKRGFEVQDINAEYQCLNDSRVLMEQLHNEHMDVLFLDIDMPYYGGMEIAGYINENKLNTILVFVTSHDALVYQTFAYRPFGIIRKTHIDEELPELIQRIKKELNDRKQELTISKSGETTRLFIKDIVYVEAEGNYLNICTDGDVYRIRETMTNIENELNQKGFIRCHKGYLINSDYITKIRTSEIEMQYTGGNNIIPVGRSYEKEVHRRIREIIRD